MNVTIASRFSGAVAIAVMASAANLGSVTSALADVNVGALACQPTAVNTAGSLLWHQHYLVNPLGGTTRTVVCNIPYDTATMPQTFSVGAFGLNSEASATLVTTCVANVVDLRNQHVPTLSGGEPFLDNPGQDMSYSKIMSTKTRVDYLWSAWATMTVPGVAAAMMDPPPTPIDKIGTARPEFWTITVNCQLKPGQALNMVSLFPTVIPLP